MSWKPIFPNHAIERVRVEVVMAEALPARSMERLGELIDQVAPSLGFGSRTQRPVAQISFATGPDGVPLASSVSKGQSRGWQVFREVQPNVNVEAVILDANSFSYEISEYSRWENFITRFLSVCEGLLLEIEKAIEPTILRLEYTDRFIYDGDTSAASPKELLNGSICALMPDSVKSGAELWHTHLGWFSSKLGQRILVNQNFDAQDGQLMNGDPARSVQIFTRVERRSIDGAISMRNIRGALELMHDACNDQVKANLHSSARLMIGLM